MILKEREEKKRIRLLDESAYLDAGAQDDVTGGAGSEGNPSGDAQTADDDEEEEEEEESPDQDGAYLLSLMTPLRIDTSGGSGACAACSQDGAAVSTWRRPARSASQAPGGAMRWRDQLDGVATWHDDVTKAPCARRHTTPALQMEHDISGLTAWTSGVGTASGGDGGVPRMWRPDADSDGVTLWRVACMSPVSVSLDGQ